MNDEDQLEDVNDIPSSNVVETTLDQANVGPKIVDDTTLKVVACIDVVRSFVI